MCNCQLALGADQALPAKGVGTWGQSWHPALLRISQGSQALPSRFLSSSFSTPAALTPDSDDLLREPRPWFILVGVEGEVQRRLGGGIKISRFFNVNNCVQLKNGPQSRSQSPEPRSVTLFGSRVSGCEQVKDFEVRPSWVLNPVTSVLKREAGGD